MAMSNKLASVLSGRGNSIDRSNNVLMQLAHQLPVTCDQKETRQDRTCMAAIDATLLDAVLGLGYEGVRYTCLAKNITRYGKEISSFSVTFNHFPPVWTNYYDQQMLYLIDPVVRMIQERIEQQDLVHGTWGEAYTYALQNPLGETEEEKEIYLNKVRQFIVSAEESGLRTGYFYCRGDRELMLIMSLCSSCDENPAADMIRSGDFIKSLHSVVTLINQATAVTRACQRCAKSLRMDGAAPVELSGAELCVLQLFHQYRSATIKQIAEHYGRSVDTVNHHLRSIREKFNMPGASGNSLATYAIDIKLI